MELAPVAEMHPASVRPDLEPLPLDVLLGARPQVSSTAMQAVSLVAGTGSL